MYSIFNYQKYCLFFLVPLRKFLIKTMMISRALLLGKAESYEFSSSKNR